jgi:hypothetical protein
MASVPIVHSITTDLRVDSGRPRIDPALKVHEIAQPLPSKPRCRDHRPLAVVAIDHERTPLGGGPDLLQPIADFSEGHMKIDQAGRDRDRCVGSFVVFPDVEDCQIIALIEALLQFQGVAKSNGF